MLELLNLNWLEEPTWEEWCAEVWRATWDFLASSDFAFGHLHQFAGIILDIQGNPPDTMHIPQSWSWIEWLESVIDAPFVAHASSVSQFEREVMDRPAGTAAAAQTKRTKEASLFDDSPERSG